MFVPLRLTGVGLRTLRMPMLRLCLWQQGLRAGCPSSLAGLRCTALIVLP